MHQIYGDLVHLFYPQSVLRAIRGFILHLVFFFFLQWTIHYFLMIPYTPVSKYSMLLGALLIVYFYGKRTQSFYTFFMFFYSLTIMSYIFGSLDIIHFFLRIISKIFVSLQAYLVSFISQCWLLIKPSFVDTLLKPKLKALESYNVDKYYDIATLLKEILIKEPFLLCFAASFISLVITALILVITRTSLLFYIVGLELILLGIIIWFLKLSVDHDIIAGDIIALILFSLSAVDASVGISIIIAHYNILDVYGDKPRGLIKG